VSEEEAKSSEPKLRKLTDTAFVVMSFSYMREVNE
jgi:hypothetical protein